MNPESVLEVTERTKLQRRPNRGHYDRDTLYSILDEGMVCHLGFAAHGQTFVVPTAYGRSGDRLFVHGSAASRMMKTLAQGVDVCLTVTLLDGLVLARSAFHHSVNYRSAMVFGRATVVDENEKYEALRLFMEQVTPGRWDVTRPPTSQELKGTTVLALPIEEASAKIRTGPPIDDPDDMGLSVWAGVIPVAVRAGAPIEDGSSGLVAPVYKRYAT
ncbi:MAG: pyridoxamine 5'-phosphate oxidase family protein [Leptospirales bacterium]|nr:pyridoxamine 5'-phosphate oxidase family protein [Leptospirales bacterium]